MKFEDLNINTTLLNAINDVGYDTPTPIQEKAFPVVMSGKDIIGIAQTGTGKTWAYLLPLIRLYKFTKSMHPTMLILVPTRELVLQVVEEAEKLTAYSNLRVGGFYGGTNINTQKEKAFAGLDLVVATPGRLFDLGRTGALRLKKINKLVIDEVDEMMNLGFRTQLNAIFELLPERRQNIMFSATMNSEVEKLIHGKFINPVNITIAPTGTPIKKIEQAIYKIPNFNSKVNLLSHLIENAKGFTKVLVFVKNKRFADRLFERIEAEYPGWSRVIHSNKMQNYRIRSVKAFQEGNCQMLIATDIIARGIDVEGVSHVINFDLPEHPENYMHRIGRTGRAEESGIAYSFVTDTDQGLLSNIERMMKISINQIDVPEEVEIREDLIKEETPDNFDRSYVKGSKKAELAPGFHEKKEKNKKTNQGGSYRAKVAAKYKKPKTRGQKRK
ncbi:MAG: DEAD/DEAH box helicase [Salibacteraceae bacterium]